MSLNSRYTELQSALLVSYIVFELCRMLDGHSNFTKCMSHTRYIELFCTVSKESHMVLLCNLD